MWDLPGLGLKPVSPELAGGFLTNVPPGKPKLSFFNQQNWQTFTYIDEEKKTPQITKIKNERTDINTNFTEIKGIIREYYEQMYTSKLDNREEMDKFLETHLPRVN